MNELFAGCIGTREPEALPKEHVQLYRDGVVYLVQQGYTIRTGAARGADQIAAEVALAAGGRVVLVPPWERYEEEWRRQLEMRYPSRIRTCCYQEWNPKHATWLESVERFHPRGLNQSQGPLKLHARNYGIVRPCQAVLALPNATGGGGTGQGLRLVQHWKREGHDIVLFNLHQAADRAELRTRLGQRVIDRALEVWTDAAFTSKGRALGWAVVARCNEIEKEWSGALDTDATASTFCELVAIREGIHRVQPAMRASSRLRLCSDSEWCVMALNLLAGRKSSYREVKCFTEETREILGLLQQFGEWELVHVRGHQDTNRKRDLQREPLTEDERMNCRCDRLAQQAVLAHVKRRVAV